MEYINKQTPKKINKSSLLKNTKIEINDKKNIEINNKNEDLSDNDENDDENDDENNDEISDDESEDEDEDIIENKLDKKNEIPSISTIYHNYFTRNRINLQPNYQREFTWTFEKMCMLIDSLMKGYVIPSFILYKISPEEKKENQNPNTNYDYECIDGQHRLKVLQKFMNSESIQIGPHEKYIYWENIKKDKLGNKTKEKVFYKLIPEIKAKYKKDAREMTLEEKNFFEDTQLQFIFITSKLVDKQKCDIFNRLQNGEKVSSITKVKNISHPITNYLRNNNIISLSIIDEWNDIIKTNLIKRGSSNSKNNYLIDHFTYLVIRLILIYDKKSLDINYLNLNIRKYLEGNYTSTQLNLDIDIIYKNIIKIRNKIIKKFDGYNLISELFILIFFIKINNKDKYDKLNKKSIKEIMINYNNIDKYKLNDKNKVVTKDIMNKFYKEIIDIINKY